MSAYPSMEAEMEAAVDQSLANLGAIARRWLGRPALAAGAGEAPQRIELLNGDPEWPDTEAFAHALDGVQDGSVVMLYPRVIQRLLAALAASREAGEQLSRPRCDNAGHVDGEYHDAIQRVLSEKLERAEADRDILRQQLAAAREDAARLDWLEAGAADAQIVTGIHGRSRADGGLVLWQHRFSLRDLRAAIDAARRAAEGERR